MEEAVPVHFPTPFDALRPDPKPRTLVERKMVHLSQTIREKPGWVDKATEHAHEWKAETLAQEQERQAEGHVYVPIGGRAIEYVLAELTWYAGRRERASGGAWLEPAAVDGTWQADGLVAHATTLALVREVARLEAGPADWHPGTSETVRDLVHPSLYCLVYGASPVVGLCEGDGVRELPLSAPGSPYSAMLAGRTAPRPVFFDLTRSYATYRSMLVDGSMTKQEWLRRRWDRRRHCLCEAVGRDCHCMDEKWAAHQRALVDEPEIDQWCSHNYAWLPSEFEVDGAGGVSVLSYINNLHPCHKVLYGVIADVFAAQLPLFERVLGELRAGARCLRIGTDGSWYDHYDYSDGGGRADGSEGEDEGGRADGSEGEDEGGRGDDSEGEDDRVLLTPQPRLFEAPPPVPPFGLRGRRLQVIVKLANIELSPDRPRYSGGSWHVEGMRNEYIVATGLYYYSNDNVTAPRLLFREAVDDPDYDQNDEHGVRVVYELEDGDHLVQDLGSVETREGRCLVFPNVFQHCVGPCELVDRTRPGRRRILAFFLVDPTRRIVSTQFVPPQQPSWFMWTLWWLSPLFRELPLELVALIARFMERPVYEQSVRITRLENWCDRASAALADPDEDLSEAALDEFRTVSAVNHDYPMADAALRRAELMEERKVFTDTFTEEKFERPFSLCEH